MDPPSLVSDKCWDRLLLEPLPLLLLLFEDNSSFSDMDELRARSLDSGIMLDRLKELKIVKQILYNKKKDIYKFITYFSDKLTVLWFP